MFSALLSPKALLCNEVIKLLGMLLELPSESVSIV